MRKFGSLDKSLRDDECEATIIEYTVLAGLITVAVLLIIGAVATQIEGDWVAILDGLKVT